MPKLNVEPFARKFHLRDGRTRRTKEPSRKLLARGAISARCQSLSEALCVRRFEIDRNVIGFKEQREAVTYEVDGKFHRAFPDFKVWYVGEVVVVTEVKDASKRNDEFLIKKTAALEALYHSQETGYEVVFSDDLYREPGRSNVELILWCRNSIAMSDQKADEIVCLVAAHQAISIDDILRRIDTTKHEILHLCGLGRLLIDVDSYIDGDAMISP